MSRLRGLLFGGSALSFPLSSISDIVPTGPTVATITGITLSSTQGVANSASGTIVGTLSATVANGPLVNPIWLLTSTAGGDFQLTKGNAVAFLPNNVPAGSYTITAQVSADNAATYQQTLTINIAAQSTSANSAFPISFAGQAGTTPSAAANLIGLTVDGNGNLDQSGSTYRYTVFTAPGVLGDGVLDFNFAAGSTDPYITMLFRSDKTGTNCYFCTVATNGSFRLGKIVGGSYSDIASTAIGTIPANAASVGVRLAGSTIALRVSGVEVNSWTDTTYTSGYIGVGVHSDAGPKVSSISSTQLPAMVTGSTVNPTGVQGTPPPVFSDLLFTQPMPVDPSAADATPLGWMTPVGGIGPYFYSITAGNVSFRGPDGKPYSAGYDNRPCINYQTLGASATFSVTVTDGRGVSISKTFALSVGTAPLFSFNGPNPLHNAWGDTYNMVAVRPSAPTTNDFTLTNQVGSAASNFRYEYGSARWITGGKAAAGTYPLQFHWTDSAGVAHSSNVNYQIVDFTPITYMEFVPGLPLTTATSIGSVIASVLATTPSNFRSYSLSDPSGTFTIDPNSGRITTLKVPTATGSLPVTVTVNDGYAGFVETVTFNVSAGVVLDPANINWTPNAAPLDNYRYNQSVGGATIGGLTSPTWSISYPEYNPGLPLFAIDAKTGALTAPGMLSAREYDITITAQQGNTYCRHVITVTPVWATPQIPVLYVGAGFSANPPTTHGVGPGFDTWSALLRSHLGNRYAAGGSSSIDPAIAGATIYIDNVFDGSNDYGNYDDHQGFGGPVRIKWLNAGGARPHFGGAIGQTSGGYQGDGQKGFFNLNNGEVWLEGLDVSYVNGYGSPDTDESHGISGIRKNSGTYGDLTVKDCYIHDCNNGVQSSADSGRTTVLNSVFANCGVETVGSGWTHGLYLDGHEVVFSNNLSYNHVGGHCLKTRCKIGTITNSRFLDGEAGNASGQLNIPQGGLYTITGCVFQKGPNGQNPYCLNIGEESAADRVGNVFTVNNNTFIIVWQGGSGLSIASAVNIFNNGADQQGQYPSVVGSGNSLYVNNPTFATLFPAGANLQQYALTGTATLTSYPALSFADPGTANPPAALPGKLLAVRWGGGNTPPNFPAIVQFVPTSKDYVVPASASAGTVIDTIVATGMPQYANDGSQDWRIEPFAVSGAVISIVQDDEYFSGAVWPPASAYTIRQTGNGTGGTSFQLLTGSTARPAGVDIIKVRATTAPGAANYASSDWRFYVVRA